LSGLIGFSSEARQHASGTQRIFSFSSNFLHKVVLPLDSDPKNTNFCII
jgi:hypothetical protein